jgi:hypothetical protein
MFVADTLGNPYENEEWIPNLYKPIAESREQANQIKRQEPITVVIGNPLIEKELEDVADGLRTVVKTR